MNVRGRLAQALELPQVLFGGAETVIYGREEVTVTECHKILRYSPDEIAVLVQDTEVALRGKGLTLVRYQKGAITVRGKLDLVRFGVEEQRGEQL